MDQLLAKLTNLGYELFGVILPGAVTFIFLAIWWVALGPLAPYLSSGFFPQLTSNNASTIIESISIRTGIGIAFPILIITYFLGHILLWIARSGKQDDQILKSSLRRTCWSLRFQIPKFSKSYDAGLQPLLDLVQAKFAESGTTLTWQQFFPVAKNYLARNLTQSLVSNYQNKYTLHRSITLASAVLFWCCVLSLLIGGLTTYLQGVSPRWWILSILCAFSLASVWGFSDSYAYHWQLFGNTIITETYSLIYGPENVKSKS